MSTFKLSHSVTALILIRLDARVDEWVGVAELASHMAVDPQVVTDHIELMHAAHGLLVQRINGLPWAVAKTSRAGATQCA